MAMSKQFKSMRSDVRKQATVKKTGGGGTKFNLPEGVSFYNPKKGTEKFRIIPYIVSIDKHPAGRDKGDIWYDRKYSVHFNIGAESKAYVCPRTVGKRCPICEYRLRLAKSSSPDEQAVKDLKAKDRVLYNIHDTKGDTDNVLLWDISYHNFTKKLDEELTEGDEDLGDFPNPDETGMILSVRFVEKVISAGATPYVEASRIDFETSGEELSDAMMESALDLDTILKILPFDELEAIFLEMNDDSEGESGTKDAFEEKKKPAEKKPAEKKQDKKKEEDTEDPAAAERARKEAIREAKKKEKEKAEEQQEPENECPGGGTYGVDTDSLKACDTCSKWDACITAKEG